MAQGSIRKGFFFYFGLFLLLLVTVFLICLVIMMFNPGKTVLWMKYFSGNEDAVVAQTTGDGSRKIDYGNLTDITINCNYAKVTVQSNKEYDDDYIIIRNHAKGFAGAKKHNKFSYNVKIEGTNLIIDVAEPNGFLYFSKDIEVIINNNTSKGSMNLSNINLKVNAKGKSHVYLGGTTNKQEESFSLKSLDVVVNDGSIKLGQKFSVSGISGNIADPAVSNVGLRLVNQKGSIQVLNTSNKIQMNNGVVLGTYKGRINVGSVEIGNSNLIIDCKKGTVAIDKISAGQVTVENCVNGNYKLGEVSCDMSFRPSADSIISPIININKIGGNFSLDANRSSKDAPTVNIKNAEGDVSVRAAKGNVKVENVKGSVTLQSEGSMVARVTIDKDNSNPVYITNEKGKVFLKYMGMVSSDAKIISEKASLNIDFTKDANFEVKCLKKDNSTPMDAGKVKVNIGSDGVNYDYNAELGSLLFAGSTSKGFIALNTNGVANFNLFKPAEAV